MTTDIIEINDFVVLIDSTDALEAEELNCQFDDDIVGVSFYSSGDVDIEVTYGQSKKTLKSRKGVAFAFSGNNNVRFSHKIMQSEPLKSVSIFLLRKNMKNLPAYEKELFGKHFENLLTTENDFETGPKILMTPEMQTAISKIFQTQFKNSERLLFLKSQILELLSHYFTLINSSKDPILNENETGKIQEAKEIIIKNIDKPPTLGELSKLIGMNNNKLKKNFKQVFGVSVFKYLQEQRLQKAYHLLDKKEMNVQEVAWYVGYDSLSSFSNAFRKKYGFRPSSVLK